MTLPSENQEKTNSNFITIVTACLYIWFAAGEIALALVASASSDDAMFMSVPKNWLNGYGWATSYSEKIPFNPDFTAGPTLLMPAALLLKLFGNQPWIAGMTGVIVNLLLIALCLWQLRTYRQHLPRLSLPVFLAICIIVKGEDFNSLIGYYTASLLFFLALFTGFNTQNDVRWRAATISFCTATGLLTKPLALPAFAVISSLFCCWEIYLASPTQKKIQSVCLLIIPALLILGSWQYWKSNELATYSREYQQAWHQYGTDFFRQHGSGIAELDKTQDIVSHIQRNTYKNFFFLEQILKEYRIENPFSQPPADDNHIAGIFFVIALTLTSILCVRKKGKSPWYKIIAATSLCSLLYSVWFLTTAMAMSPGHTSFPIQFGVTALLLLLFTPLMGKGQSTRQHEVFTILLLAIMIGILKPVLSSQVFLFQHEDIRSSSELLQAKDYIQSHRFRYPLAGCGYGGYPRHLEYLLPGSQNFSDCYDLIEDHAEIDETYYVSHNNVDKSTYKNPIEHFHAFIGRYPIDYRFHWKNTLNFTLVISLQSPDLFSKQIAPIIQNCTGETLYRNNEVLITECRFEQLQKINLDEMMAQIAINQRWYKTRLNPYEGRHFSTLHPAENTR